MGTPTYQIFFVGIYYGIDLCCLSNEINGFFFGALVRLRIGFSTPITG